MTREKMIKRIKVVGGLSAFIIVIAILLISILSQVFVKLPEKNYTASEVNSMLNLAEKVTVRRKFALNKKYVIFADDIPCCVVEGKKFPVLGDTLSLIAPNNDVIGSVSQEVLHLTQQAQVYDNNNKPTIRFEKGLFAFSTNIVENDKEIGKASIAGLCKENIKFNDKVAYTITSGIIVNKQIIEKESGSNMSIEDVILMCCFDDTVKSNSSSSKSNSKSK